MADDRMSDEELSDTESETSNQEVITKYKAAADIVNRALAEVIKECVPGKLIVDLCNLGDKFINDQLGTVYNKGKIEKGVAFPTSVSVNHTVGHFSPLAGDPAQLEEGDVVKVDLGAHIDGYISTAAHTVIATANRDAAVTGRKADVICAAHYAAECAHRLIKPGKKNTEVTEAIAKVAEIFGCQPMEGVLSHQMKRFVIDGNKVIINKATLDQKVDEFEFEDHQVYAVDIVMSTGEGKSREMETRTTIFKRAVDQNYLLKMKAARYVFNEINQRFPTLPFTLRALDESRARLGITECLKHDLVHPYPVLYEKQGEFVAQFKFTVLVVPSGTFRLNSHPLPFVNSEKKIEDPALLTLLQTGTKRTKKNKKKKKKPASGEAAATDSTNTTAPAKSATEKMDTKE
jgi:curved DNA binding protein